MLQMLRTLYGLGLSAVLLAPVGATALSDTTEVEKFLLVGRGSGDAVKVSNESLTDEGNVAVTNPNGTYDFSDVDISADIGIRCFDSGCEKSFSGSTLSGGGTFAADATQMAKIEKELVDAAVEISALSGTDTWGLSGAGTKDSNGVWKIGPDGVKTDTTITLGDGLNVIKIDTNGTEAKIEKDLVINGGADSSVIFLLVEETGTFKFNGVSVTKGIGGIGSDSILFALLGDADFDFSNVIVDGTAFWDLSGGKLAMSDVNGCGQWVGASLELSSVQLSRCAFSASQPMPEPSAALAFAAGLLVVGAATRRPRPRA